MPRICPSLPNTKNQIYSEPEAAPKKKKDVLERPYLSNISIDVLLGLDGLIAELSVAPTARADWLQRSHPEYRCMIAMHQTKVQKLLYLGISQLQGQMSTTRSMKKEVPCERSNTYRSIIRCGKLNNMLLNQEETTTSGQTLYMHLSCQLWHEYTDTCNNAHDTHSSRPPGIAKAHTSRATRGPHVPKRGLETGCRQNCVYRSCIARGLGFRVHLIGTVDRDRWSATIRPLPAHPGPWGCRGGATRSVQHATVSRAAAQDNEGCGANAGKVYESHGRTRASG